MFSLYIHWPFCESKCPYCDFNSHVLRSVSEEAWVDAIIAELTRTHRMMQSDTLCSIFFGGGTPSLMTPGAVERVITAATMLWQVVPNLEISMEANPGSVEAERFTGYRQAGVNRLSLGIQALNDDDLKTLGRKHSVVEALKALDIAQNTFKRVSFDLIYARPHQTLEAWEKELSFALSFGTEHLSLYQLTIEPGTAFAPLYQRGELVIPAENEAYHLFKLTNMLTQEKGLPTYEISNHARIGAECQHNLTYWNYGDYVGVGPGAHGRIHQIQDGFRVATQQIKAPELWARAVTEKGSGDQSVISLTIEEQFQEQLMMGLRLKTGIDQTALVRSFTEKEKERLLMLQTEGLLMPLTHAHKRLQLTPKGLLLLNAVLRYLFD